MEINYGKTLTKADVINVNNIAINCGIQFDTARLLFYRKIDTVEKAKKFLNPSSKNFLNPFDFNDMQAVIDRIALAKRFNQKVMVYGDYDADGICATTVLYYCLKEFGIDAVITVPEREDGYGISLNNVLEIHNQTPIDLIITVDCGISEKTNVEKLKDAGIDVIVTDHHEPPENLPDCLIINPKVIGENYAFDGLCGAGVAYKVGSALVGKIADKYLDFVAVATVADSMQLTDENRDLVAEGLKLFAPNRIRPVFKYLLGENDKQVTASVLAYQIAPRVNAGGRMGDANCALSLFTSQNENDIYNLSVKLNNYNIERQAESERVYREAKEIINKNQLFHNPIICVKGDTWNSGVMGIVSAKLVEDYSKPVIVFAQIDGKYKGSARSVEQLNIHNIISNVSHTLLDFGGHSQACGLSVSLDGFDIFYKAIIEHMNTFVSGIAFPKTIYCDWKIEDVVSLEFAKQINMLEPFGVGNKKPVFSTSVNRVKAQQLKQNSPHYSFDTNVCSMLNFNGEKDVMALSMPILKDVVFEISYSVFRGKESVKGLVKKVLPNYNNLEDCELYFIRNELLKIKDDTSSATYIDFDENIIKKGYGIIYALSDYSNLSCYNVDKDIKISAFQTADNSGENCIVVSPQSFNEHYKKVVYLDQPLALISTTIPKYVINDTCGYDFAYLLDTDRQFFATVFSILCTKTGQPFENSVEAYYNWQIEVDAYSFIFAVEVFLELGIFCVENGYFKRNINVKNALTNSIMYSKIQDIQAF